MSELEKLTPEQIAKLGEWSKKWIDISLSTEPADFDLAEDAALRAYKLCNLKKPMVMLRMPSPYAATVAGAMAQSLLKNSSNQNRAQVADQVKAQFLGQFKDKVEGYLKDQASNQIEVQVRAQVEDQIEVQLMAQLLDQVSAQVCIGVWQEVGDEVGDEVRVEVGHEVWIQEKDYYRGLPWGSVVYQVWNPVEDQLKDQAWSQVIDQVCAQVLDQMGDQVWFQIEDHVKDRLWAQVLDQIGNQVWIQVEDQVRYEVKAQIGGQFWERALNQIGNQIWFPVRPGYFGEVGNQVYALDRVGNQVWFQIEDQVVTQVVAQEFLAAEDELKNDGISSLWCQLTAFATFLRDVCGCGDSKILHKLKINEDLVKSCGWTWWDENVLAISDRPKHIKRDDQGRLHCENGSSIEYRDGWALYYWHGVSIPKEWLTTKKPSAKEALTWKNIEQRRAACEIVGWASILDRLEAKVINSDEDEQIGTLLEAELPHLGKERFLQVKCGTGRTFVLSVPKTVNSALEANAWSYGLEGIANQFKPEVRT